MWRKIDAEATIEVYEIAKHFELRSQNKLAPAAFGDWGNLLGDPWSSIGGTRYGAFPNFRLEDRGSRRDDPAAAEREGQKSGSPITSRPTLHR
jgi:hypothetical protein